MPMKKPPHPGRSIKDACLEPWGLTVTEGAAVLGVARHTLSRVINGYAGISPDMAIRLNRLSAAVPIPGCACRLLMISLGPDSMNTR
jgi:antitoxin HigA-1